MTTQTRLYNIQALRGIAVLLVVLLHMYATEKKYSPDQILPDFLQLGAMGVDIFFVISGFIMVTVTHNKPAQWQLATQFLLSRATRIYPTYWLISALLLVISVFFPGITTPLASDGFFVIRSLLLYPQEHLPLLMVGWTLIHEMFFYLVFTVLLLLPANMRYGCLLLWAVGTAMGYQQWHPAVTQPELALLFNPLSLEFISGCFLGLFAQHFRIPLARMFFYSGLLILAVIWAVWINHSAEPIPTEMNRFYYFIAPCVLMTLGCIAMDQQVLRLSRWLEILGDASYSIYLTHILVLSSLCKVWQFFPYRESWIDNVFFIPMTLAATFSVGMLFFYYVEKPLLTSTRKLIKH
jgi:peptidoglycan/LPS O-acetylase OafA/YrhL